MKKRGLFNILVYIAFLYVGLGIGCQSIQEATRTSGEEGGSSGEEAGDRGTAGGITGTLVVEGAETSSCTIIGKDGTEIGSGDPSGISYTTTTEEAAIVRCGELSQVFESGAQSARLSGSSTAVSDLLEGSTLGEGTALIVQSIEDLDLASDEGQKVARSLVEFVDAWAAVQADEEDEGESASKTLTFKNASSDEPTKIKNIITLLVSLGQPVVVEKIGHGKTMTACSTDAASSFGSNVVATDAQAIGITGCLIYNSLYAVTDLNNPLYIPDNVPASFRSVARETGLVQGLRDATKGKKKSNLSSIHDFFFTSLGHTAYVEDDEGVLASQLVAASDLETFFTGFLRGVGESDDDDDSCGTHKSFVCHVPPGNPDNAHTLCVGDSAVQAHLDHGDSSGRCHDEFTVDDFRAYRYHTGYNPSGGWEIDAAAATGVTDDACIDSSPATSCPATPLYFTFDGTTLVQDADGSYILQMEFRGGAFRDFGYPINKNTSKPYRDANYQRVTAAITPSDYSAVNYPNPFYDSCLDPMRTGGGYGANCDGGGATGEDSAPYSNSTFRGLYPGMTNVDNAYLLPNPEIVVRLYIMIKSIGEDEDDDDDRFESLSAWEAYALMKIVSCAMASIPVASGAYAILNDHGKSPAQWDGLATNWIESGSD